MIDGQRRKIKPRPWAETSNYAFDFHVIAERVDDETPLVEVRLEEKVVSLTDSEAVELVRQINKALSLLPTSK